MFRIYSKEKISKEIFTVNLTKEEIKTVLGGNIFMDHPELNKNEHIVLEREIGFINPILENGEIREMTREEQILILGDEALLVNGEYINKGKILKKEIPENLISPIWNKDKKVWEENMTKDQMIELRKNKIVEYEKLEEEKKLLEGSKFSSEDEIKVNIEKMTVIEGSINELADKIKAL